MKKLLLLLMFMCSIFTGTAQVIDSIHVTVTSTRYIENGGWHASAITVDSLSGGVLICKVALGWEINQWKASNKYSYSYVGTDTTVIWYKWQNNSWLEYRQTVTSYSSPTDCVINEYSWNNGWTLVFTTLNRYNTLLQILQHETINYLTANWDDIRNIYTYDSLNRPSYMFSYIWNVHFQEWDTYGAEYWYYNVNGDDSIFIHFDMQVSMDIIGGREYVYSYDSLHRLAWRYQFDTYNTITEQFENQSDTFFYSYPNMGDTERTVITFDFDDLLITKDSLFDSAGNLVYNYYQYHDFFRDNYEVTATSYGFHVPDDTNFIDVQVFDTIYVCSDSTIYTNIITIGGNQPIHYQWSPSSVVDNDTLAIPQILTTTDQYLYYTATDNTNRVIRDSIYLVAVISPQIISSTSTGTTCIGCANGQVILNVDTGNYGRSYVSISSSVSNYNIYGSNDTIRNLRALDYLICVVDNVGCFNCIGDSILDDPTAIDQLTPENRILIYPNPTNRFARILDAKPNSIVEVINQTGQIEFSKRFISADCVLDVSSLSKGWYIVRVNEDGNYRYARLTVN